MYPYSASTKRSVVVAVAALAGVMSGQRAQAMGELAWFTNQANFEAFNADKGNILIGTEDFEESIQPPATFDNFDDPLTSGLLTFRMGSPSRMA